MTPLGWLGRKTSTQTNNLKKINFQIADCDLKDWNNMKIVSFINLFVYLLKGKAHKL